MENIYHQYWEQELLYQFASENGYSAKAYICSPLSAETNDELVRNMQSARAYMFYAMKKMDLYARAPHAYMPVLLRDRVPAERALALQFGLRLLEVSDVLLICGNRVSSVMNGEILHAAEINMPMITFDEGVYLDVQRRLRQHGRNERLICLDRDNFLMGFSSPTSYREKVSAF